MSVRKEEKEGKWDVYKGKDTTAVCARVLFKRVQQLFFTVFRREKINGVSNAMLTACNAPLSQRRPASGDVLF